jgi:hypothetical protein
MLMSLELLKYRPGDECSSLAVHRVAPDGISMHLLRQDLQNFDTVTVWLELELDPERRPDTTTLTHLRGWNQQLAGHRWTVPSSAFTLRSHRAASHWTTTLPAPVTRLLGAACTHEDLTVLVHLEQPDGLNRVNERETRLSTPFHPRTKRPAHERLVRV